VKVGSIAPALKHPRGVAATTPLTALCDWLKAATHGGDIAMRGKCASSSEHVASGRRGGVVSEATVSWLMRCADSETRARYKRSQTYRP